MSHPKKMVRWSAGLLASLLMLFAGYGIWTSQSLHLGPADFRIDGCNLIAVDTKGHELWRHAFRYRLVDSLYRPENMYQHAWLGDLDGDGRHEIVFLKHVENESGSDTAVLCFGPGGTVRWQFTPGRAVDDASGDHMVPPYFASSIEVIKGIHPDDTRIAVSSIHYMAQPDQVAILNASGRLLGEYWHPGHISHLAQAELDGNRRKELLLGGVNNGDHQATLVVLDPFHIIGRTTPTQMSDHRFALTHMQPAHEEAVVLFPRSCISYGQPYTRVCVLRVTPSRILVNVAEGAAENYAGFVYELDHELHVVSVSPTDIRVPQLHEELRLRGILDHHFSMAAECERLKSAVIVHRET